MEEYFGSKIKHEAKEIFEKLPTNSFEDHALGCMVGAFVADSMGSLVEFETDKIPEEKLDEVMKMPGGGPHKVGPGQITDDSEMAMSLLWGLTREYKKMEDK